MTTTIERLSWKQNAMINRLMESKDIQAEVRPKYRARLIELASNPFQRQELTRMQASALIDTLMALPIRNTESKVNAWPTVVAGYYALQDSDTIRFYVVDRPVEGPWVGYVFVSRVLSDERAKMTIGAQHSVLKRIAANPAGASMLYGQEIGSCGVCHRTLTNEESREAGIGPVCRSKNGW